MTVRTIFAGALALCAASLPVYAQGYVGGFALDSASNAPLPCVQVALLDTTGRAVARQLTMPDGAFQFDAPPRGKYHLGFVIWAHEPLITSDEDLEPTTERARKFSLSFHKAQEHRQYPDSAADAPPVPPLDERNHPKFPDKLYWKGIRDGEATADFLVDSAGTVLPASLTVSSSTDQAFADELTRYLVSARFKPARLDRMPVCALMRDVRVVFHAGARSR